MAIADWLDAALGGFDSYRQGRDAPLNRELLQQKVQRGDLQNQTIQSALDDLMREREERAQASGASERVGAAYMRSAPRGTMENIEDYVSGQTPNTPMVPSARTTADLMSYGATPSDIDLMEKYRPGAYKAMNLTTPEAVAKAVSEGQQRTRSGQLQAELDQIPPGDPEYAQKVRAVITRMAGAAHPGDVLKDIQRNQAAGEGQVPTIHDLGNGIYGAYVPNEATGVHGWKIMQQTNMNPGQITDQNALATLISDRTPGFTPQTTMQNATPDQAAAIVRRKVELQNNAAGGKAREITINTGQAKLELPIGEKANGWVNAKGEFPNADMPVGYVQQHYFPQKDALKRLDEEGQSRVFLQHIQMLREKGTQLFPDSSGNAIQDAAVGRAQALIRRAKGQSDAEIAAIMGVDRPAALQMANAVAKGVRNGARMLQIMEEITNPYNPWTKQSYLAALDSLEQLAKTRLAQVGRPGMNPQPPAGGVVVPPASPADRSPAPTSVPSGPGAGATPAGETVTRTSRVYLRAREAGLSDAAIEKKYNVRLVD